MTSFVDVITLEKNFFPLLLCVWAYPEVVKVLPSFLPHLGDQELFYCSPYLYKKTSQIPLVNEYCIWSS